MAVTQAQIDAIIASAVERKGAIQATFADQSVTFESWDKLRDFIRDLRNQLSGGPITRYAATDKDL